VKRPVGGYGEERTITPSQPLGFPTAQAARVRHGPLASLRAHTAPLELCPEREVAPCTVLALVVCAVPSSLVQCRDGREVALAKLHLADGSRSAAMEVVFFGDKTRLLESVTDAAGHRGAVRIGDVVQISSVKFSVYSGAVNGSVQSGSRLLLACRGAAPPTVPVPGAM